MAYSPRVPLPSNLNEVWKRVNDLFILAFNSRDYQASQLSVQSYTNELYLSVNNVPTTIGSTTNINADYEDGMVFYFNPTDITTAINEEISGTNIKYFYTVREDSEVYKWVGKKYPNDEGTLVKNIYDYIPCGLYLDGPYTLDEILFKYPDFVYLNYGTDDRRIYKGPIPRTRYTSFRVGAISPYFKNGDNPDKAINIFASCQRRSSINDLSNLSAFISKENPLQPMWLYGTANLINPSLPLSENTDTINEYFSDIFFRQSTLDNYLRSLGIPFTFDLDEAINSEIPIPEPPEIPPIPFPDVDPGNIGESVVPDYDKETTDGLLGPEKLSQFFMAYHPSDSELRQIGAKFWSQNILDTDQILKIIANPADAVFTCMRVPYVPSSNQSTENPFYFTYGPGIQFKECPTPVIQKQYEVFNFGEITFEPFFENFMDYSPYTKIQLYVPFIGFTPILPEEWIGYTMNLTYIIDNLTGSFQVLFKRISGDIEQVVSTFSGKIGAAIPITSFNYGNILSTVTSTVTAAATAGFSSYNAIAKCIAGANKAISKGTEKIATAEVNEKGYTKSGQRQANSGREMILNAREERSELQNKQITQPLYDTFSASLNTVLSQPNINVDIARSGSLNCEVNHMNYLEPYVIITRANPDVPLEYNKYFGRPCNKYLALSSLTGFTVFDKIHLDGVNCSETEKDLIDKILTSGVLL